MKYELKLEYIKMENGEEVYRTEEIHKVIFEDGIEFYPENLLNKLNKYSELKSDVDFSLRVNETNTIETKLKNKTEKKDGVLYEYFIYNTLTPI